MATCPRCGHEVPNASKEWDSGVLHVKKFDCGNCKRGFNASYREGRLIFTQLASDLVIEGNAVEVVEGEPPREVVIEESPREAVIAEFQNEIVEEEPIREVVRVEPVRDVVEEEPVREVVREGLSQDVKRLFRSKKERMIAGVCGGIAEYFNVDPTMVRLAWIVFGSWGFGLISYIIAWIIVPEEPESQVE